MARRLRVCIQAIGNHIRVLCGRGTICARQRLVLHSRDTNMRIVKALDAA